jgi:hypothetical protein
MIETIETIGPKEAMEMLKKNPINRDLDDRKIDSYVYRMRNGLWDDRTPATPISIGKDGSIYNGQHELWAIVITETTHRLKVCRDCPPEVMQWIDCGKSRSLLDRLNIAERMNGRGNTYPLYLAVVKGFYRMGGASHNSSVDWNPELYDRLREKASPHVDFTMSAMVKKVKLKRLVTSPCLVAIARAHAYGIEEDTLKGFAIAFFTGESSRTSLAGCDQYVHRIRERILTDVTGVSGWKHQEIYYHTVAKTIALFSAGLAPLKICTTTTDPFPLSKAYLKELELIKVTRASTSCRARQEHMRAEALKKKAEEEK